ncbi:MAG: phosphonate C-P lyase system protein PhnG [Polaromonas sp.]|nr:phosphonate C-P lyase system protein PhnG [Polaromonas sp.]
MTTDETNEKHEATAKRRRHLAILARATTPELEAATRLLGALADVQYVRPAEVGMNMLRGRIGGTGDAFNLGEATVTRCALRVGNAPLGVGYSLGRDRRKAELIAVFDSLLQEGGRWAFIEQQVIDVLGSRQSDSTHAARRAADTSKVEFFTFVRGAA